MTERRATILKDLIGLSDPRRGKATQWFNYHSLGWVESDVPLLVEIMFEESEGEDNIWVPLHCWRALGQFRALDALKPILNLLDELPEDDDWLSCDLPDIASHMGAAALPILAEYLNDGDKDEFNRTDVSESIARLGCDHTEAAQDCAKVLSDLLEQQDIDTPFLNGALVSGLLDLKAADRIDTIRRAYASEAVDSSICGDMEDVEIALGFRQTRSTPRKIDPRIEELRASLAQAFPDSDDNLEPYVHPTSIQVVNQPGKKVGRNEPCPCGSGKKYKKCCLK